MRLNLAYAVAFAATIAAPLAAQNVQHDRVPPGHLPPKGMCRVWIDGVPPGQQPAVTDCATAQTRAATTANSRVIYGDNTAFPGKGKGKFKGSSKSVVARGDVITNCPTADIVLVDGRRTRVCRETGQVISTSRASKSERDAARVRRDDDEDDDRNEIEGRKIEKSEGKALGKHKNKGKGKGKDED